MGFHQVVAGLHALFDAIGLPGNLLVIVTIALEMRFHIMRHILLASLALSDFLCLILVNSFCILSTAQEKWPYGQTLCHLHPFFARYFYLNTVLHLIAVSYDRYNAIVKSPLTYDGMITKSRMVCIVFIWLAPITVFIAPVVGVGKSVYNPEVFLCEEHTFLESIFTSVIVAFLRVFLVVIPFVIIVFLNWSVFKTARNLQGNVVAVQLGSIEESEPKPQQQETSTRQRERKAAVDVAIIIAVFLLCFVPGWTLNLFRLFGKDVPAAAALITRCFFFVSSLCNPIIYSIRKREFRTAVKNMLRRISGGVGEISFGADKILGLNNSAFSASVHNEASTAAPGESQVIQPLDGRISFGADNILDMDNSAFEGNVCNEACTAGPGELQVSQPLNGRILFGADNILGMDNSAFEGSLRSEASTAGPGELQVTLPLDGRILFGADNTWTIEHLAQASITAPRQ